MDYLEYLFHVGALQEKHAGMERAVGAFKGIGSKLRGAGATAAKETAAIPSLRSPAMQLEAENVSKNIAFNKKHIGQGYKPVTEPAPDALDDAASRWLPGGPRKATNQPLYKPENITEWNGGNARGFERRYFTSHS